MDSVSIHARLIGDVSDFRDPDGVSRLGESKLRALANNPFAASGPPTIQLVAVAGSTAIGSVCLFPGAVDYADVPTPVYWGSSLFVSVRHRNSGAGVRLIQAMGRQHHTVVGCRFSKEAEPLYLALGWQPIRHERWILPVRTRAIVERFIRSRHLAVGLSRPIDRILTIRHLLARSKRARFQFEEYPPTITDYKHPSGALVRPHRSIDWLNWISQHSFADGCDERAFLKLESIDWQQGGYALTKLRYYDEVSQMRLKNFRLASIIEWFTHDGNVTPDPPSRIAVNAAVSALRSQAVDAIEVSTRDPLTSRFLKQSGFYRLGENLSMFRTAAESPLAAIPVDQWAVGPFDGDAVLS